MTYKELEEMACVDVCSVDIDNLTDLREIKIDRELPLEEKLASFEKQTKNVYVNRVGDYAVKVKFQKDGADIDDKLEEYFRHMSQMYI